jgi:hypothetical protein
MVHHLLPLDVEDIASEKLVVNEWSFKSDINVVDASFRVYEIAGQFFSR